MEVKWRQRLGRADCPYAERWVLDLGAFSIRLHHFLHSDDDRAFHDHPWWFVTLVLRGSYIDRSPAGDDVLRAGSVRYRPALHRHTVVTEGVWTVLVTGPQERVWGFWPEGKFRRSSRYFRKYGHHPCE